MMLCKTKYMGVQQFRECARAFPSSVEGTSVFPARDVRLDDIGANGWIHISGARVRLVPAGRPGSDPIRQEGSVTPEPATGGPGPRFALARAGWELAAEKP